MKPNRAEIFPKAPTPHSLRTVLVCHDSANPWYAALMLRGFTRFARTRHWRLVFVPRTNESREASRLRRLVAEFEPIGLFANYTEGLGKLAPKLLPTVWFDCATWRLVPKTASLVNAEHAAIAALAAEETGRSRSRIRSSPGVIRSRRMTPVDWSSRSIPDSPRPDSSRSSSSNSRHLPITAP